MPKYGDKDRHQSEKDSEPVKNKQAAATKMAENFRMDTVELLNQVC